MNSTARTETPALPREPGLVADLLELGKLRITTLVLLTTAAGYGMGANGLVDWWHLGRVLLATACVATGIFALNHYMERDLDARMVRTQNRPLPAGRMEPLPVLVGGVLVTTLGLGLLWWWGNLLSMVVGLVVTIGYVLFYTPLKTRTNLNTLVGLVPGSLPPVLGWVAVQGRLGEEALALFLIMFFWQTPHFLAIAWLGREDYARAGMVMISVADRNGARTRRQLLLYTAALLPVSLYPTVIHMAGTVYFSGALLLSLAFLAVTARMALNPTRPRAILVLKASVFYLPLLFGLMLFDTPGF